MDFIQTSNKQIDKFGPGKHGFSAGNPALGQLATYLSNTWCDGVQQEIINAIEASSQVPTGADQSQLAKAIPLLAPGRLLAVRVFTAVGSSTYAPTAGTKSIVVLVQGGGGGGGAAATSLAGQSAVGAGGGGGGWAYKRITAGFTGATIQVGIGGAGGNGAGGSGGTSSFGAFCSATGGGGGAVGGGAVYPPNDAVALVGGTVSGIGSGGDWNGLGGKGFYGIRARLPSGGSGGFSHFGDGASGPFATTAGSSLSGGSGLVYGGGGAGGVTAESSVSIGQGGSGAGGVVIVWEYA